MCRVGWVGIEDCDRLLNLVAVACSMFSLPGGYRKCGPGLSVPILGSFADGQTSFKVGDDARG